MTQEREELVRQLVQAAKVLPPVERPAYLTRVCEGDDLLREEVEELLILLKHVPDSLITVYDGRAGRQHDLQPVTVVRS